VVLDIEAAGGKAIAVQGDIGNEDDILRLFAETTASSARSPVWSTMPGSPAAPSDGSKR
jgi:hypothetical protein